MQGTGPTARSCKWTTSLPLPVRRINGGRDAYSGGILHKTFDTTTSPLLGTDDWIQIDVNYGPLVAIDH